MPLPNTKRQFLQEVIEPEVSAPVEPEVLSEIVEEAPAEEDEEESPPKIGGRIQRAVNKAKTTIQTRKK